MSKKSGKSRSRIPKRIAGVKVPKSVRTGRFGELLASPKGQAAIAEAIMGVGAVAAGLKARKSPEVRRAVGETSAKAEAVGASVAFALGEAARTFLDALRAPEPPKPTPADEPAWASDYGAPRTDSGVGGKPLPHA